MACCTVEQLMAVLPRAGRRFFLGGDWLHAGKPHPPMEAWKADLLGLDRSCNGRLNIPSHSLPAPLGSLACSHARTVGSGNCPNLLSLVASLNGPVNLERPPMKH